jgi:hypothetical protein
MLSSLVKINDNAARRHQSAPIPISAPSARHISSPPPHSRCNSSTSSNAAPCLHTSNSTLNFLIANPRLEFTATDSKLSPLTISNREYIAVFHFTFHPLWPFLSSSPATHHSTLATEFLIETPRLEFPVTHTKQSFDPISNRDKTAFSRIAFPHSARRPVAPAFLIGTHRALFQSKISRSVLRERKAFGAAGAPTGNRSAMFTGGPGVGS